MLYYLYLGLWEDGFSLDYKPKNDSIKRQVKKYISTSLHNKFVNNHDVYYEIKSIFDANKSWASRCHFTEKNVLFGFQTAILHPPEIFTQIDKFNL
jgi:hypothetical protein